MTILLLVVIILIGLSLMATVTEIKEKLTSFVTQLTGLFASLQEKVDALQAAVASGGAASQAELDELSAAVDAAQADLVAKAQAIVEDNA